MRKKHLKDGSFPFNFEICLTPLFESRNENIVFLRKTYEIIKQGREGKTHFRRGKRGRPFIQDLTVKI